MKKKTIAIILLMWLILSVSGCKNEKIVVDVKPEIKPNVVIDEAVSVTETVREPKQVTEQEIIEFEEEKSLAEKTETTVIESKTTTPKKENSESTEKRERKFLDNDNPEEIVIVPITPQVIHATSNDSRGIADKILEYINSYRTVPAQKLDGLTRYSEYRSRQLISRFAHNTEDERAAATALQYGEYVEPALYCMDGEPYYTSCSREAIAKAGYAGTVDEIAQKFVNLIKNSTKHWCYVGADEYSYIGVGVTYESGMWYCDIAVAKENTDEK